MLCTRCKDLRAECTMILAHHEGSICTWCANELASFLQINSAATAGNGIHEGDWVLLGGGRNACCRELEGKVGRVAMMVDSVLASDLIPNGDTEDSHDFYLTHCHLLPRIGQEVEICETDQVAKGMRYTFHTGCHGRAGILESISVEGWIVVGRFYNFVWPLKDLKRI